MSLSPARVVALFGKDARRSSALMLRSRAFGSHTRIFHVRRRGVSKHEGRPSSPFETRACTFDFVEALQQARSSG